MSNEGVYTIQQTSSKLAANFQQTPSKRPAPL